MFSIWRYLTKHASEAPHKSTMFFQCYRFKFGQVFVWETTGHIGDYIVLGLENMTTRLVSIPSNNIKTSTISSSANGGHLTWLNLVSAMARHFRKWNACLCGCFSFWNDHITFSFILWYPPNIIIEKNYHHIHFYVV